MRKTAASFYLWKKLICAHVKPLLQYVVPVIRLMLHLLLCALQGLFLGPPTCRHPRVHPARQLRITLGLCQHQWYMHSFHFLTDHLSNSLEVITQVVYIKSHSSQTLSMNTDVFF